MSIHRVISLAAVMLVLVICVGCASTPHVSVPRHEFTRLLMGVEARIVVHDENEEHARQAAAAAFERIAALDRILSDYQIDSEINRLCAKAGGPPVAVSDDLFAVLERSIEFSRASGGAFDVTVGPLVKLWREARRTGELPWENDLLEAMDHVGWRKIDLDPRKRTVRLRTPGLQIDFGGIGKGYASDEALEVLRKHGCPIALVQMGGDIALGDPPPVPGKTGWSIDLPGRSTPALLSNCAVATSGDSVQFVEIEGVRYSHIVDPRTGFALTDSLLVTVIAPDATTADALASAIGVLGEAEGRALAAQFDGVVVNIAE